MTALILDLTARLERKRQRDHLRGEVALLTEQMDVVDEWIKEFFDECGEADYDTD